MLSSKVGFLPLPLSAEFSLHFGQKPFEITMSSFLLGNPTFVAKLCLL